MTCTGALRFSMHKSIGGRVGEFRNVVMAFAVAKCDGDVSSEEKHFILDEFQNEFELSKSDASGMMSSSV